MGLERLLSDEEPKLADGTVLSAHQVDALSGTLTALLAEAQRTSVDGNGRVAAAAASPELLASAAILGPDDAPASENDDPDATQDGRADPDYDEDEPEGGADEDDDQDDDEDEDDEELGPVQRAAPDEDDDEDEDDEEFVEDCPARTSTRTPTRSTASESESDEEPRDWVEMTRTRRSRWPSSPRTPTRPSASGSSTPPAPARRSPRSASSRPRRRAAS